MIYSHFFFLTHSPLGSSNSWVLVWKRFNANVLAAVASKSAEEWTNASPSSNCKIVLLKGDHQPNETNVSYCLHVQVNRMCFFLLLCLLDLCVVLTCLMCLCVHLMKKEEDTGSEYSSSWVSSSTQPAEGHLCTDCCCCCKSLLFFIIPNPTLYLKLI